MNTCGGALFLEIGSSVRGRLYWVQDIQRARESSAAEAAAVPASGKREGSPFCALVRHLGRLGEGDAGQRVSSRGG